VDISLGQWAPEIVAAVVGGLISREWRRAKSKAPSAMLEVVRSTVVERDVERWDGSRLELRRRVALDIWRQVAFTARVARREALREAALRQEAAAREVQAAAIQARLKPNARWARLRESRAVAHTRSERTLRHILRLRVHLVAVYSALCAVLAETAGLNARAGSREQMKGVLFVSAYPLGLGVIVTLILS
jgi:hypothetical protein